MSNDAMTTTAVTPARWRASSHSQANGACLEVADGFDTVPVRDSKDTTRQPLTIPRTGWTTFLTALADRRLD